MSPANQSNGAEVVGSLQLPGSHSLLLGIGVSGWRERRLDGNKLKKLVCLLPSSANPAQLSLALFFNSPAAPPTHPPMEVYFPAQHSFT